MRNFVKLVKLYLFSSFTVLCFGEYFIIHTFTKIRKKYVKFRESVQNRVFFNVICLMNEGRNQVLEVSNVKVAKQTGRLINMALLTKMGKTSLSFSGRSFLLPVSENMSMRSVDSWAQSLQTPMLEGGMGGVITATNGGAGGVFTDGTPGDAAILTPFRVD